MEYERQIDIIFAQLSSRPTRHPCASRAAYDVVYAAFLQAEDGPGASESGQPLDSERVRVFRAEWNVWAYYFGEGEPFPGSDPAVRDVDGGLNDEAMGGVDYAAANADADLRDFENGVRGGQYRENNINAESEHGDYSAHRDVEHERQYERKGYEGGGDGRYDNETTEQRESFIERRVRERVEKRGQKFQRRLGSLARGRGTRRRGREERSAGLSPRRVGGFGISVRGRDVDTYFGGGVRARDSGNGGGGYTDGGRRAERRDIVDQGPAIRGIREDRDRGNGFEEGRGFGGDGNVHIERRHLLREPRACRARDGAERDDREDEHEHERARSLGRSQKGQMRARGAAMRGSERKIRRDRFNGRGRQPLTPRQEYPTQYSEENSSGNGHNRTEEWVQQTGYENERGYDGESRRENGLESGWIGREDRRGERSGKRDLYRPGRGEEKMSMGMDEGKWFAGGEVGDVGDERGGGGGRGRREGTYRLYRR